MRILYLPNEYSQQRQKEKKVNIYPILMAMEAEWYRRQTKYRVDWGSNSTTPMLIASNYYDKVVAKPEGLDFLTLPKPDRIFTGAMDKKYQQNGNFKHLPGTYILSANGCWHGKCVFCVENKTKEYQVRPVFDIIREIRICMLMGFREVFDDSGTFPIGRWLDDFIREIKNANLHRSVYLGCNMRLVDIDYGAMKEANFRMLLFGVESASQETLDRINKEVRCDDIKYIRKAAEAGLEPHVAVMFGYPWETDQDSIRTLKLVHYLLKNGYAKTAQASFYTTPGNVSNESQRKYVKQIYNVTRSPRFWLNKIRDIKNTDDLKYLWRSIKKGVMR